MSTYILDAVYSRQKFSGLKWAWLEVDSYVNTNFKMLFKCSFRGVITWMPDNFFTSVYKMIFQKDPPCMSMVVMEAIRNIAYWYASPSGTFIRMYSVEKPPHVLLKLSLDIFVMEEVAYHILSRLIARLHRKKKAPWPTLPLRIQLYKIFSFKHENVEAEKMNKYPFDLRSYSIRLTSEVTIRMTCTIL